MDDAKSYTERYTLERIVKAQSGHVPVPISIVEKPGAEPPRSPTARRFGPSRKSEITAGGIHRFLPQRRRTVRRAGADHPFPRRGPARIHRARLRAGLAAVRPVRSRPQGPHEALRQARLHHRRGRDPAALSALRARPGRFRRPAAQRLARDDPGEPDPRRDQEGRDQPRARRPREARRQGAARPTARSGTPSAPCSRRASTRISSGATRCSASRASRPPPSAGAWRSLKDYVAALKANQTAIYYIAGDDLARLEASPHLEGFRARGIEVLLLPDPVDSFWVTSGVSFDGKPFKSVTQGAADLGAHPAHRRQAGGGDAGDRGYGQDLHRLRQGRARRRRWRTCAPRTG